jgi:uncharacterized protein (DUF433 family)
MKKKIVREMVGGQVYEYVPLGTHVVSAPGVCGGRPTFKYTRVEVARVLERLAAGHSVARILASYDRRVSREALREALALASKALVAQ